MDAELAASAVRMALDSGASGAECTVTEGEEFSAVVRMRRLQTVKDAGSRAAGIRVLAGRRAGSSFTSDMSAAGIRGMVRSALEIAAISSEDPYAGLPEPRELGALPNDLALYCDDVNRLDTPFRIAQALAAEEAALSADPRIANSDGASFNVYTGARAFANSQGFAGAYRTSRCSLIATPVARQGDAMERDRWYSAARCYARLDTPANVGRIAAERALRRLGARKADTQKVPVVFDAVTARSLLEAIFDAVEGVAVYRKASFLGGKLGRRVASENVTVIDDGTIPGLFGTLPFDDEGVPTRRKMVIERGVLRSYLLNSYTARKLGMQTTGNAERGLTGNAQVGHGNLYLEKGAATPEEIVGGVRRGLYVTELIGSGVNTVSGDYSRGAAGLWIENGELAYPVSGITIAANLLDMFMNIERVGSDLEFRASVAAPTLLIGEMTVSGR